MHTVDYTVGKNSVNEHVSETYEAMWQGFNGVCEWQECGVTKLHAALFGSTRTSIENGTSGTVLWRYGKYSELLCHVNMFTHKY